jgi:hypothetical protein
MIYKKILENSKLNYDNLRPFKQTRLITNVYWLMRPHEKLLKFHVVI